MSTLADLTAAGDSTALPGYTLSPFTLRDYGELEREFEAQALAQAKVGAIGLADATAREVVERAIDRVLSGRFSFGSTGFDDAALKVQNLPFLLYLSLRRRHPDVTRERAMELVDGDNAPQVQAAVLSLAGYVVKKKADQPAADPSTGTSSSPTSSSEDSATPTSPT